MNRSVLAGLANLTLLAALASCLEDDGGAHARAVEMKFLATKSFIQAGGSCDDPQECAGKEAGFAYAKRTQLTDPDDCSHKGDEDFIDGCQRYGDDIDAAMKRARKGL